MPVRCWSGWAWLTDAATSQASFRAASVSALRWRVRW